MRIKSYKCNRFAGLRDIDLEFSEGLNVLLGPNESGKSTVVDGIHSTLFKNIKLRKNNNSDINFTHRYMPRPSGDFIDGRVTIGIKDKDYEIYRGWGSKEDIHFRGDDGSIIKDEAKIDKELIKLLSHGSSTYTNIVFAKQRDLKRAINNIIENSEVTDEISDLLRRTMMELEGVSIEKIEKDILDQIDSLYKRWDRDKNYPQNNKGINNPYKNGLGEILASFYKKEELLIAMEETARSEKAFEDICEKIQSLEKVLEPLKARKESLEEIENDVNSRQVIELKIDSLNKALKDLLEANKNWPRIEEVIKGYDEKLKSIEEAKTSLTKEKKDIELLKTREALEKKVESIERLEDDKTKIVDSINAIAKIEKEDIDNLSKLEREILTIKTTISASKMIGELKSKGGGAIYLSRDFGEKELLNSDDSFEANGVINISNEEGLEIEIKTGDIDFEDLNNKLSCALSQQENLLRELQIKTIEEGKLNLEKIRNLNDDKKSLQKEMEYILEGKNIEEIKDDIEDLKDINISKSLEEIEKTLQKNDSLEREIFTDKKIEAQRVEKWEEEYTDHDTLLDILMEKKALLKKEEERLKALKPLPEEFKTSQEFKEALDSTREELKSSQEEMEELTPLYYDAKMELRESSFEEVEREYQDAQKNFDSKVKRGEKLLEIQRVFLKTKEELSNNPMESLVDEFARLLDLITDGDYRQGEIDEKFHIKLSNSKGEIPVDLLSAGTYDSVTLALRFSLLKHIFSDGGGYVVLDDCLVDLDPARKEQSVKLINDFAKDYQIIFTTCDPETAKMLGGNIIQMG